MAIRYCLDTNSAIYFLSGRLSESLPEGEWLISVITELELRSYSFATADDEREVDEFIEQIPVVDLTPEIKKLAITMRRDKRLKLPDAIIVATSQITQATLVTNDNRLGSGIGHTLCGSFLEGIGTKVLAPFDELEAGSWSEWIADPRRPQERG